MCDSKELLVGYLYDELDPATRRTFEAHAAVCADCRHELAELHAARGQIAAWTPPEPDLGFRVIRSASAVPPPIRFRIAPAWGLAAAALLVMALGAAIANLEIRVDATGLSVRTGWQRGGEAAVNVERTTGAGGVATVDWKAQAEALDRRLRELEQSIASRPAVQAAAADVSDSELIRRVHDLVGQSETRQQRLVAARLAELSRNVDAQRKLDLAVINQGMTPLQNTSGAEEKQYRDLTQRVIRTALQK
jgi:hypothetical protein